VRPLIRTVATSGRGAQAGSGGIRSTGQVGPATTRPAMPEPALAAAAAGRPAKTMAARLATAMVGRRTARASHNGSLSAEPQPFTTPVVRRGPYISFHEPAATSYVAEAMITLPLRASRLSKQKSFTGGCRGDRPGV